MSVLLSVARNELKLLAADPYPVVLLILMPVALLAFLSNGLIGGPGEAVPGVLVLFAFIGLYNVGLVFFREHGWGTWSRLRTMPIGTGEVVAGKLTPVVGLYLVQSVVVLLAGFWLFGMPMNGHVVTLAVVVVVIVVSLSALGLMLVSICRTMNQVAAAANVGGLLLAGMGGALSPVSSFPSWAQTLARLSPVYWALLALRGVIIDGETLTQVGAPLLVLLGVAVVSGTIGLLRFDAAQVKEYYA